MFYKKIFHKNYSEQQFHMNIRNHQSLVKDSGSLNVKVSTD